MDDAPAIPDCIQDETEESRRGRRNWNNSSG